MSDAADVLCEVVLREVPVQVWARAQEQTDALLREFALVTADAHDVPRRLTELVAVLDHQFAGASSAQEEALFTAAEGGVEELPELRYLIPAAAGQAAADLGALLDEADAYCAHGRHLLTLAAPHDVVQLRRWWLEQFTSQIAGAAPVPWPQWAGQQD